MPPYSFQDPNVGQAAANIGTAWFGNPQLRQASALSRAQQNLAMSGIDLNSNRSREIAATLAARAAVVDATRNLPGYTSPEEAEFAARTMGLPNANPEFAFGVSNTGDPSNPNGAFRNAAIQGRGISNNESPTLELFNERMVTDHTNNLAMQAAKPHTMDEVEAGAILKQSQGNPGAILDLINPPKPLTPDELSVKDAIELFPNDPRARHEFLNPKKPMYVGPQGELVVNGKSIFKNDSEDPDKNILAALQRRALTIDNAAKVQKMEFDINEAILKQFGKSEEGDRDEVSPEVINAIRIRVNRLIETEGVAPADGVATIIKQMRANGELNEGGLFGNNWWFGEDIQLNEGVSAGGNTPIDLQPTQPTQPKQTGSPSRAFQQRTAPAAQRPRVSITTQEEFNNLPPGTRFDLNGRTGTKQ